MHRAINEAVGNGFSPPFNHGNGHPAAVSAQARELLNLRRLPAMLNAQQAAIILGVVEHDIPVLIRAGLLKPLGNPPANAVKYFAGIQILELAGEPARLGKMRDALYRYWQNKNAAKNQSCNLPQKGSRNE